MRRDQMHGQRLPLGCKQKRLRPLTRNSKKHSCPGDSFFQLHANSQNRRSEQIFPMLRVVQFTQIYPVALIVLENADSPVDTD